MIQPSVASRGKAGELPGLFARGRTGVGGPAPAGAALPLGPILDAAGGSDTLSDPSTCDGGQFHRRFT